jgi:hypothetical protein
MPTSKSKRLEQKPKAKPKPNAASDQRAPTKRPLLIIDQSDFPAAAGELSKRLANSSSLLQRGAALVKLVKTADGYSTLPLNVHDVVNYGHAVCRPVVEKVVRGEIVREPVTLPERVARLYLNRHDAWGARDLSGICRAPILSDDGYIRIAQGYDADTRYWCVGVETPSIPDNPSRRQAEKALASLRAAFATFPFADAALVTRSGTGQAIDLSQPPRLDEATYLAAVLTAVCRPSRPLQSD